jgi:hypothetical protein
MTALEAFLGDTLINAVMSDPKAMQRLLDQDRHPHGGHHQCNQDLHDALVVERTGH